MAKGSHDILLRVWRERADGRCVFRGMSLKDLADPLDPARNPFEPILPKLRRHLDLVRALEKQGLPRSAASVEALLPGEDEAFTVRMHRPLCRSEIERIDEVTPESARNASGPRGVG